MNGPVIEFPSGILLRARWVVPVAGPPIRNGAVLVTGERIAWIGPDPPHDRIGPDVSVRDCGDAAILPGLVNAHSHLELTVMRGMLEDADFRTWITKLTAVKLERMSPEDLLDSARIGAWEAVRAGVTCVGDTCDSGTAVQALRDAGLRGTVYQEIFGPDPAQADASMQSLAGKLARLDGETASDGRVRVGVSPHAPFTVSAELFRRVTALALASGRPMAIHAAESVSEAAFLRDGSGPFGERFAQRGIAWTAPETTTIGWFEQLGVLDGKPLLIHAVQATEIDLDRIAASGATVAHCPKSNAKLGHGVAPLRAMLDRGLAVGLGTDSVASNNVCDVLDEARAAVLFARAKAQDGDAVTARDALALATIGGARALGLDADVGTLEAGKLADLCIVSLDALHVAPVHDVEAALVFSASARDVVATMVGGRFVYDRASGGATLLDEPRLARRLAEICRSISSPRAG